MDLNTFLERDIMQFLETIEVKREEKISEVSEEMENIQMDKNYPKLLEEALKKRDLIQAKNLFEEVNEKLKDSKTDVEKDVFLNVLDDMYTNIKLFSTNKESEKLELKKITELHKQKEEADISETAVSEKPDKETTKQLIFEPETAKDLEDKKNRLKKAITEEESKISELMHKNELLEAIKEFSVMKEKVADFPTQFIRERSQLEEQLRITYNKLKNTPQGFDDETTELLKRVSPIVDISPEPIDARVSGQLSIKGPEQKAAPKPILSPIPEPDPIIEPKTTVKEATKAQSSKAASALRTESVPDDETLSTSEDKPLNEPTPEPDLKPLIITKKNKITDLLKENKISEAKKEYSELKKTFEEHKGSKEHYNHVKESFEAIKKAQTLKKPPETPKIKERTSIDILKESINRSEDKIITLVSKKQLPEAKKEYKLLTNKIEREHQLFKEERKTLEKLKEIFQLIQELESKDKLEKQNRKELSTKRRQTKKEFLEHQRKISEFLKNKDIEASIKEYKAMKKVFKEHPYKDHEEKKEFFTDLTATFNHIKKVEELEKKRLERMQEAVKTKKEQTLQRTKEQVDLGTRKIQTFLEEKKVKKAMQEYEHMKAVFDKFPREYKKERKKIYEHMNNLFKRIQDDAAKIKKEQETKKETKQKIDFEQKELLRRKKEVHPFMLMIKKELKDTIKQMKKGLIVEADNNLLEAKHMTELISDEFKTEKEQFEEIINEVDYRMNFLRNTVQLTVREENA